MRLKLLKYTTNIEIKFVAGNYLLIADLLSTNFDLEHPLEDTSDLGEVVHSISVSKKRVLEIKRETSNDKVLSRIKNYCLDGCPSHQSKISKCLRLFFKYKENKERSS